MRGVRLAFSARYLLTGDSKTPVNFLPILYEIVHIIINLLRGNNARFCGVIYYRQALAGQL